MKKLFFLFTTVVVAFVIFKCCVEPKKYINNVSEPKMKLLKEIINLDMSCPVDLGYIGKLQSAQYDDLNDTVYFKYLINESVRNFMVNDREKSLRSVKLFLLQDKEKTALKFLTDAGASISVTCKFREINDSIKFIITSKELKELYEQDISDFEINKMLLDNEIDIANAQCPMFVQQGLTTTKTYDNGSFLVYEFFVDSNIYDLSLMKMNINAIKNDMISSLKNPSNQKIISILLSLNRGWRYHYYDINGESVDISFSNDELKSIYNLRPLKNSARKEFGK